MGGPRESGGGRVQGGWINELVYLVSACVSLVLVLVLGWTQCLPQGVGAPPAMLAGTHGWLPKKTGRPGLRSGGVGGYNLPQCPPPPTVAHQPRAGCIRSVLVVPLDNLIVYNIK